MEAVRVISTTTVQARRNVNNGDSPQLIDMNPWDLQNLVRGYGQKGLLYNKPTSSSSSSFGNKETMLQHLKDSLSATLDFYPPLAGRLVIIPNDDDDGTSSVFITCNNAGASFVHAIAENITIADIVEPTYVPPILFSFFQLCNVKNFEGTQVPLMAVQVTELVDGIFVTLTMNHSLIDVMPAWEVWNVWAEISRNGLNHIGLDSKLATFERWFPHEKIQRPIRIPFKEIMENYGKESSDSVHQSPPFSRRIFHFTKEKIAELKAKANSEVKNGVVGKRISSLQAVIGHVWRAAIINQDLEAEEEVTCRLLISARSRVSNPPIPDNYFGVTSQIAVVKIKVGDLVGDRGFGRFALEMNKAIASFTEEKIKRDFEAWVKNPTMRSQNFIIGKVIGIASSPRINFYDIDYGWGRPVAIRLGPANTRCWKLAVDAGVEEGSFDFEFCASHEILEAMGRDPEFMSMVSSPPPPLPPPVELPNKLS